MAFTDVFNSIGGGLGDTVWVALLIVVVGGIALIGACGLAWYWFVKKRWNLKVEIKMPRSDGRIIHGEWAKGFYNAKRGVVLIKRKGVRGSIPMEVFDVKRYLQGTDLLTLIQVAPEDYRPVLNYSWTEYIDEESGKKEAVMDIKIDTGLNKAWKSSWEAAAKRAYSLQSFFAQFQTPIAIGIVILSSFVGFAIIWTRLGSICGGG